MIRPILFGCLALTACCPRGSMGPGAVFGTNGSGIVVTGVAEINLAPEVARLVIGVEAQSTRVDEAMQKVAERSVQVKAKLVALGIASADIEGAGFEVLPEEPRVPFGMGVPLVAPTETAPKPQPAPSPAASAAASSDAAPAGSAPPPAVVPPAPEQTRVTHVSNRFQITIRDVARLRTVLSELVAAGANRVLSLSCDVKDRSLAMVQTRDKAMASAKQRAQQLAKAAGVELGNVEAVVESPTDVVMPVPPMPMNQMAYGQSAGVLEMAVSCDRVRMVHTVTVQFAID